MERQQGNKNTGEGKKSRIPSPAATAAFLILAILFIFGVVRLLGGVIRREFAPPAQEEQNGAAAQAVPSQTPRPEPSAEPPVTAVIALPAGIAPTLTPDSIPTDPPEPGPQSGAAETPAPTRAPVPSAGPGLAKTRFTKERMDVALLAFDEKGKLDILALCAVRGERFALTFVPVNTLDAADKPISRHKSVRASLASLETIVPVDFDYYIFMQLSGLSDCVDAAGGLTVAGRQLTGDEARAYIEADGSDELLRMGRIQALLEAYLARFSTLNFIRLAATKAILSGCAGGNLSTEQYLSLLSKLRRIGDEGIHCGILPVDSVLRGGARRYMADAALVEQFVQKSYPSD